MRGHSSCIGAVAKAPWDVYGALILELWKEEGESVHVGTRDIVGQVRGRGIVLEKGRRGVRGASRA